MIDCLVRAVAEFGFESDLDGPCQPVLKEFMVGTKFVARLR